MKKHIPNFITLLNLAAGFLAIIFLFNDNYVVASWLVVAAMIFDFCDGFAARLLNSYSELGKQLDSLADVVSFGVVPGLITYYMIITGRHGDGFPAFIFPVLIPLAAALRLAKFNIDDRQKETFIGLPTPAAAIAIVSVVLADEYGNSLMMDTFAASQVSLCIYSVIIAYLMVSPIPMISLKFSSMAFKENTSRYILLALILLSFVLFGFVGTALIIPVYLMVSIGDRLFR